MAPMLGLSLAGDGYGQDLGQNVNRISMGPSNAPHPPVVYEEHSPLIEGQDGVTSTYPSSPPRALDSNLHAQNLSLLYSPPSPYPSVPPTPPTEGNSTVGYLDDEAS